MLKFKFHNDNRRPLGNVFNGFLDNVTHRRIVEEVQMLSNAQTNQSTNSAVETPQPAIGFSKQEEKEDGKDEGKDSKKDEGKENNDRKENNEEGKVEKNKEIIVQTVMKSIENLQNEPVKKKEVETMTSDMEEAHENKTESVTVGVQTSYVRSQSINKREIEELPA